MTIDYTDFMKWLEPQFRPDAFTTGHCHDLAFALYELHGGNLLVCYEHDYYVHTILEDSGGNTWDIGGIRARPRWTDFWMGEIGTDQDAITWRPWSDDMEEFISPVMVNDIKDKWAEFQALEVCHDH